MSAPVITGVSRPTVSANLQQFVISGTNLAPGGYITVSFTFGAVTSGTGSMPSATNTQLVVTARFNTVGTWTVQVTTTGGTSNVFSFDVVPVYGPVSAPFYVLEDLSVFGATYAFNSSFHLVDRPLTVRTLPAKIPRAHGSVTPAVRYLDERKLVLVGALYTETQSATDFADQLSTFHRRCMVLGGAKLHLPNGTFLYVQPEDLKIVYNPGEGDTRYVQYTMLAADPLVYAEPVSVSQFDPDTGALTAAVNAQGYVYFSMDLGTTIASFRWQLSFTWNLAHFAASTNTLKIDFPPGQTLRLTNLQDGMQVTVNNVDTPGTLDALANVGGGVQPTTNSGFQVFGGGMFPSLPPNGGPLFLQLHFGGSTTPTTRLQPVDLTGVVPVNNLVFSYAPARADIETIYLQDPVGYRAGIELPVG